MQLLPTIYKYKGRRWHGGFKVFDSDTRISLLLELLCLIKKGKWCYGWNWPELIFGCSRMWYDGPHWNLNLGVLSISLSSD